MTATLRSPATWMPQTKDELAAWYTEPSPFFWLGPRRVLEADRLRLERKDRVVDDMGRRCP